MIYVSFRVSELASGPYQVARDQITVLVGTKVTDAANHVVGEITDVEGDIATAEIDETKLPSEPDGSALFSFIPGRPKGPKQELPSIGD
jgi:hypothetical protein